MIFGRTADGDDVRAFDLRAGDMSARVIEWGGALQDLRIDGVERSLVLGFPALGGYVEDTEHLGAVVGRVANRLSGGRFAVGGMAHLATRNIAGRDTLHGGDRGWGRRLWRMVEADTSRVALSLHDPDGAEGFPGCVDAELVYELQGRVLEVTITARVDRATVLNPSHHHYFNLSGEPDVSGHELQIVADHYTPLNAALMPTGEVAEVGGDIDWRAARIIGDAEIDLNYVVGRANLSAPRHVARLAAGGVAMTVATTAPGLQVYTGDNLPPGHMFGRRAGICLEPQIWPDAPNHPAFPSIEIGPGQVFRQVTRFSFDVA